MNELDGLLFNGLDGVHEVLEGHVPISLVIWEEDVIEEVGEFHNLLGDLFTDVVNVGSAASDGGQFIAENGIELFSDLARRFQVLEDPNHVCRLLEQLVNVVEIPSRDSQLVLDLLLGSLKLYVPAVEHQDARLDVSNCICWLLLRENGANVDLVSHFLANFVGNGLQNVLKLLNVVFVVNVAGNGPDELESIKEGPHGLSDRLELALGDDFELSLQGLKEFDEVLGLSLALHEVLLGNVILVDNVGELVVLAA